MSGIDINSMNDDWKKYAQIADDADRETDVGKFKGNKKLDLESVFEKQAFIRAARADQKTDEQIKQFFESNGANMCDIEQIFQIELSNTQKQNSSPTVKSKERSDKTSRGEMSEAILKEGHRYYKDKNGLLTDTVDWSGMAASLVNYYSSADSVVENKEYSLKLSQEVAKVADLMKDVKYANRKDVEGIYKNVKKELDKLPKDEFTVFRATVLKDFVLLAEEHQKAKEQQILANEFKNLRNSGKTRTEAYESIQKDERFKGSYFHDTWSRTYADKFEDEKNGHHTVKLHKGLIHQMQDGIILEDAKKEVYDAVWAQRGKAHLTTGELIEKEVEKIINQDKYTDKIMNKNGRTDMSTGQRIRFERSDYKDWRKAIAAYNSVENKKGEVYTRDDFYNKAFKKNKNYSRFNQLSRSGPVIGADGKPVLDKDGKPIQYRPLITQAVDQNGKPLTDKDGNPLYDLSRLSELIKSRISPTDMRANYSDKMDPEAEINTVVSDIKRMTAVTTKTSDGREIVVQDGVDITYEEACNLIDMCGFERDNWDLAQILRTLGRAGVETIKGMVTAATTALIIGAAQGDPMMHVEQAITHVSDPKTHAETNIDQLTEALLGMTVSLGMVVPDNGVNLNLDWKINVKVNGEEIDVNSAINRYEIKQQLDQQLRQYADKGVNYGIKQVDDGSWHLWISIPPDVPYEDRRNMYDILGKTFDLKTDTGVEFEAKAVIDENGEVVVDKEAEAVVDDKGKATPTKKMQGFLWGTAINYGLNLISQFLKGLDDTDKSIISTKIDTNSFAEYSQQLSAEPAMKKYPALKDGILKIAELFYVQGKWDDYEKFLREIAGGRSRLNRKELLYAIETYLREHEPTLEIKPPEDKKPEIKPEPKPVVEETEKAAPAPKKEPGVYAIPFKFDENVEANYHFAHKHTWQGIAAMYDECKKHGYTQDQIVRKIKEINGIRINDNVIPQHLYLPEFLFGEDKGKKAELTEKQIYVRDQKLTEKDMAKDIRSNGTKIGTKKTTQGWIGMKGAKMTKNYYPTEAAAKEAAKDL